VISDANYAAKHHCKFWSTMPTIDVTYPRTTSYVVLRTT